MSRNSEHWPTESQLEEARTLEYEELYGKWLSDPQGFLDGFSFDKDLADVTNLTFYDKLPFQ